MDPPNVFWFAGTYAIAVASYALLGALPQLEGDTQEIREGRLVSIPGRPPDLIDPPEACRFGPRCPYAHLGDSCTTEPPPLREGDQLVHERRVGHRGGAPRVGIGGSGAGES